MCRCIHYILLLLEYLKPIATFAIVMIRMQCCFVCHNCKAGSLAHDCDCLASGSESSIVCNGRFSVMRHIPFYVILIRKPRRGIPYFSCTRTSILPSCHSSTLLSCHPLILHTVLFSQKHVTKPRMRTYTAYAVVLLSCACVLVEMLNIVGELQRPNWGICPRCWGIRCRPLK